MNKIIQLLILKIQGEPVSNTANTWICKMYSSQMNRVQVRIYSGILLSFWIPRPSEARVNILTALTSFRGEINKHAQKWRIYKENWTSFVKNWWMSAFKTGKYEKITLLLKYIRFRSQNGQFFLISERIAKNYSALHQHYIFWWYFWRPMQPKIGE